MKRIIVVGGGHAGICAALVARQNGAEVTLVECAPRPMRGGNTRHTRNLRVAHSIPVGTLTEQYSEDEYWADLERVTNGNTNEDLARMMIQKSLPHLQWLQTMGVKFQAALSGTLNLSHSNAFFLGGGKALLNTLYNAAEQLGVGIQYNATVTKLKIEDGTFQSLTIATSEGMKNLDAEILIAASGGFQANEEWMEQAWGAASKNFLIRGTPYNTGLVLQSLLKADAASIGQANQCHAVAIDARAPKYDGGITSRLDCVCYSVVVNKAGKRFADEGQDLWPKRYAVWGRLVAGEQDQTAFAIYDQKVVGHFMPSLYPPITASNIEELAQLLDVDKESLKQTIDNFNDHIPQGTSAGQPHNYDPSGLDGCTTIGLTPPKTNWALSLDQPPYYAYPLRPGITFTYLGVAVNQHAQVLFNQESGTKTSSNIYAAGEIMAGNILGEGYCAGTGMAIGGVFGRIAGEHAVCQLK